MRIRVKGSPGWDSYDPRRLHWSCDPDYPDGHAGEGRSRTGKIAAKAAEEGKYMNSKGVAYLDWSIRELHPDADIDQDTVRVPLESYRLAIILRSFSLFAIGAFASSFFLAVGTAGISVDSLPGFVAGSVFILVGATGAFFTVRMFLHCRDLMNKGETILGVIRKIHAMGRMKW